MARRPRTEDQALHVIPHDTIIQLDYVGCGCCGGLDGTGCGQGFVADMSCSRYDSTFGDGAGDGTGDFNEGDGEGFGDVWGVA